MLIFGETYERNFAGVKHVDILLLGLLSFNC